NELIGEAIALVEREQALHGVVLRLELAAALPGVRGDRTQLQQVLVNLLRNAIQAMASVEDRPRELVVRTRLPDRDQVVVTVQDTVRGVHPAHLQKIFDAFLTPKPEGTGVGLSLARSVIAAHGGTIWVSRNLPHGSAFHFALPARP